ncbi:hypothetical protein ACQP25_44405 (plasmid) [Microtetraspora malaysiensis]|uniref:hypothetical protein n=1 Tax=Microtetraspora malaysiensis TaxID=161358 RepID=UPI003D8FEEBD
MLVEGEDLAGMLGACVQFTSSPRVGESFLIPFGESRADEFGAAPGARFEVVEHDGSFAALMRAVEALRLIGEQALAAGQAPICVIIDSMPAVQQLLHAWTYERARRSEQWRRILLADPDAEIDPARSLWIEANARHSDLVAALRRIPGYVLLTSHGRWQVTGEGRPVEGAREWIGEHQRGLGSQVSAWVRMFRQEPDVLVGLVHSDPAVMLAPKGEPRVLAAGWSVEHLVFEVLGFDPAAAEVARVTPVKVDRSPVVIAAEAMHQGTKWARLNELRLEAEPFESIPIPTGRKNEETPLGALIAALMEERAVSDPAVVAALEESILEAVTAEDLHMVGAAVRTVISRGQVSRQDKQRLAKMFEARMTHIRAEEAERRRAEQYQEAHGEPETGGEYGEPDDDGGEHGDGAGDGEGGGYGEHFDPKENERY